MVFSPMSFGIVCLMVDLDYLPMHKGHVWSLRGSVRLGVQSIYVVYVGNVVKLRGWDFNPAKIESGTWINLHGSLALEPRSQVRSGLEHNDYYFFFFWFYLLHVEVPRPRIECHSSDLDGCSDKVGSLTFCATKEWLKLLKTTVF